MVSAPAQPYSEALELLWGAGTCAGLSDGQLLARFLAGRDEAGEMAFEVLVMRHGPMVERVCHQLLDDPRDVHDAWQAVFLVLARRAGAIKNRESVGGWLHGVAVRVAKRTKMTAARRHVRDRRTNDAAEDRALEAQRAEDVESCVIEREERAEVVHQEISRLPEKYRAPIVLCYMEGLTHDEAAASLSWPLGTVRSRLSRGRDTLRRRLSRRGLAAPAVVGSLGAWLAGNEAAAVGGAAAIPNSVAAQMVRLALQAAAGSTAGATPVVATSFTLAEGVLKMMTLKKLMVIAATLMVIGTISIGARVALVRTSAAQDPRSKAERSEARKPAAPDEPAKTAAADDLAAQNLELVRLARERFETQLLRYNAGDLPLDDLIKACDIVEQAELRAANPALTVREIKERSLARFEGIERMVDRNVKNGVMSEIDLKEIQLRRKQTEIDLKTPDDEKADSPAILRRLKELEKKVQELEKRVPRSLGGRM